MLHYSFSQQRGNGSFTFDPRFLMVDRSHFIQLIGKKSINYVKSITNNAENKNLSDFLDQRGDAPPWRRRNPLSSSSACASALPGGSRFLSGETSERVDAERMARSIFGKKEKGPLALKDPVFFPKLFR